MNIFQLFGINPGDLIAPLLIFIGAIGLFFLLVREIITWYWKINKIVSLLEQIEKNTRPKIISHLHQVEIETELPKNVQG